MGTELSRVPDNGAALSPVEVRAQVNHIQEVMHGVMKDKEHYGIIPGCGDKPVLLKAGAEKLCLTFRLDPQFDITETHDGDHLTVTSKCTLYHVTSGRRMGSGMGSCSTKESKYAWRQASPKCPKCGKETVIKGREEYGGGWVCFTKKGGCNAKFNDDDQAITSQPRGRVPNEDKADQYNTILKMANKRSLVAAVLVTTAASDIFTQDIEDLPAVLMDTDVTVKEAPKKSTPPTNQKAGRIFPKDELSNDLPKAPIGETVRLPGHGCEKCGNEEWNVREGSAKSKNPGRAYLACTTKNCAEERNGTRFPTFGGWWTEVMESYETKKGEV